MGDKKVPLFTRTREARTREKIGHVLTSLRSKRARSTGNLSRHAAICAAIVTSLLWAAGLAQAIEVAGVNLADLSHYAAEGLHAEASGGSRANGLVIVAYANTKGAERYCREAAPFARKGATVRAVFAAGAQPGKTFDVYYNGESYVRANKNVWPRAEDFPSVMAWVADLQSVDLRLAAKQREADALEDEIEALDRKIDAYDTILRLSRDPDLNK